MMSYSRHETTILIKIIYVAYGHDPVYTKDSLKLFSRTEKRIKCNVLGRIYMTEFQFIQHTIAALCAGILNTSQPKNKKLKI